MAEHTPGPWTSVETEENFLVLNPAGLDEATADMIVMRLPLVPSTVTIRRPSGAGVCWDTLQKDELILLDVVEALAELEILCGDPVEVMAGESNTALFY